jgi:hypothetical protein
MVSVSEFAGGSCTVAPYDTVCATVSPTVAARYPRNINRDEQSGVEPRLANRSHLRSMGGTLVRLLLQSRGRLTSVLRGPFVSPYDIESIDVIRSPANAATEPRA